MFKFLSFIIIIGLILALFKKNRKWYRILFWSSIGGGIVIALPLPSGIKMIFLFFLLFFLFFGDEDGFQKEDNQSHFQNSSSNGKNGRSNISNPNIQLLSYAQQKVEQTAQLIPKIVKISLRYRLSNLVQLEQDLLNRLKKEENLDRWREVIISLPDTILNLTDNLVKVESSLSEEKEIELLKLLEQTENRLLKELKWTTEKGEEGLEIETELLRHFLKKV